LTQATLPSRAGARRARRTSLPPGLVRWSRPLLLAALSVWVFPTRTWLDQRSALADTGVELQELEAQRAALEQRVTELDSDEQIERIARSEYGLVLPGEEAYAVLPAPEKPVELPDIWPFGPPLAPPGTDDAGATPDPAAAASARD
jgi:hypothetical protein